MGFMVKRYRVRGIGLERLMDALMQRGIELTGIDRGKTRQMDFSVPLRQSAAAEETAKTLGFSMTELAPVGLTKAMRQLKSRWALSAMAVPVLLLLFLSLTFIWRIEISGAGIYQGEINSWLRENGVVPGVSRFSVSPRDICGGLMDRLPRIAWVRAKLEGVSLRIEVTQGVPPPRSEDLTQAGDIVAAFDGIIEQIQVFRGTAAVKAGDTVRAGDVLIRGVERGLRDGGLLDVHAAGRVKGRIWRQGEALLEAKETRSAPTGRQCEAVSILCPWQGWRIREAEDYLTSEKETLRVPIGGAWAPLWLETDRYTESSLTREARDPEALRAEGSLLAMQNLLALCRSDDEIIDKWLKIDMIEEDYMLVTATAEIQTDIGRFLPRISE